MRPHTRLSDAGGRTDIRVDGVYAHSCLVPVDVCEVAKLHASVSDIGRVREDEEGEVDRIGEAAGIPGGVGGVDEGGGGDIVTVERSVSVGGVLALDVGGA